MFLKFIIYTIYNQYDIYIFNLKSIQFFIEALKSKFNFFKFLTFNEFKKSCINPNWLLHWFVGLYLKQEEVLVV